MFVSEGEWKRASVWKRVGRWLKRRSNRNTHTIHTLDVPRKTADAVFFTYNKCSALREYIYVCVCKCWCMLSDWTSAPVEYMQCVWLFHLMCLHTQLPSTVNEPSTTTTTSTTTTAASSICYCWSIPCARKQAIFTDVIYVFWWWCMNLVWLQIGMRTVFALFRSL